jgi:hypothetical protein
VVDATLHSDGRAIINTTHDYQSLVFENNGPHTITFGVEFSTNVMGSDAWNASGGTMPDRLPTASRNGITIEPYQRLVITPSNWLDLENAEILIEGETGEYDPPGRPSRFLARSYGSVVRCEWSTPDDDGGSPITRYILYRGDTFASMNQYRTFSASDPMVWTDTDVVLGSTYFYAVAAANVAGVGPKSAAIGVFVTQDPITPDPPLNLGATVADGKVTLTWDPPEWDGGSPVTGFTIMRSEESWTSSPPTLEMVGSVSSFEDSSVRANTTYYYWVDSINKVGRSSPFGPVEVVVPPGAGGGDGDGDDGDGAGGTTPLWQWLVAIVVLALVFLLAMWFGYMRDR